MLQRGLAQCTDFAVQWIVPIMVILATCVMFDHHVGVTTLEDCTIGVSSNFCSGLGSEAKHLTTTP